MTLGVFGKKGHQKEMEWEYSTKRRVKVRRYPKMGTRQGKKLEYQGRD